MIGIIGAMDVEVSDILKELKNKKEEIIGNYTYYTGQINKTMVVVLKSGIGKVSAACGAALLIEKYKPDFIINSGIAGGSKPLHTKDIVLPKKFTYGDVDATVFNYELGQVPQMPQYYEANEKYYNIVADTITKLNYKVNDGLAVTSDSFITSTDVLKIKPVDGMICEMEGAAIAQTCHILNCPFVSIRFISDILNSDEQVKNYLDFETEMAHLSAEILINTIININL